MTDEERTTELEKNPLAAIPQFQDVKGNFEDGNMDGLMLCLVIQQWLIDSHMIRVYVSHGTSGNFNFVIYIWDKPNDKGEWTRIGNVPSFDSYEKALETGLIQAATLIK